MVTSQCVGFRGVSGTVIIMFPLVYNQPKLRIVVFSLTLE